MSEEEKKDESDEELPSEEETQGDESDNVNRRGFFTQGFRRMLKPIADVVEARIDQSGLPDWDESVSYTHLTLPTLYSV